jgi:hypothetical protein
MRSEPYDIANMEGSTIAVTVPREKAIFMFDLSRNKIIGKIVTRNYCYGLSYQNNTFIVSILDNGIQTLDRHGNILHTIRKTHCFPSDDITIRLSVSYPTT